MDLRSLIAKMDAIEKDLNEAFNIKTVQQQVGQIADAGQRHAQLATLAQQNNLPGLYDPVDGSFVSTSGSTSNTASHEVDNLLASKGLMPQNANTSTFLGKMFGTSGDKYDQGLRSQSNQVVADQTSAEFKATKFKELQDIMKELSALKKIDAPAAAKDTASAVGQTINKAGTAAKDAAAGAAAGQSATPVQKESVSFANELIESFGYTTEDEVLTESEATIGQQAAVGAGAFGAAKGIGKMMGKAVPGLGLAFGAADAYNRAKKGDWTGAGIAGLSGALSLIPGFGWIPAAALDMFNLGRDLRGPTASSQGAMQHPVQNGSIAKLQSVIGTEPDGIFGPKSQAALKVWQQKKGITVDGIPGPETFKAAGIALSESLLPKSGADLIKETANRLAEIENPQPLIFIGETGNTYALTPDNEVIELDEGIWSDAIAGAAKYGNKAWDAVKGFGKGLANPNVTPLPDMSKVANVKNFKLKPPGTAFKAGQAIARNPGKTAAALGAAGLAGGYAMGNDSGQGATPDATGGGSGDGTHRPAKPEEKQQVCSPEQMALITKARGVMGELSDMANQDPALAQVLQTYQSQIDALKCGDGSSGQGATPAAGGASPLQTFYDKAQAVGSN
jgi:peptidoglycan hydrolase-like protein with peptidoglycan-binding domain